MSKYEEQEIAYAKEIMAKALEPVEAWEKKVRENNEIFKKAGKAEKRVMIAKDVLAALKAKRIMPAVDSYYPSILTRLSDAGAPIPWFVERAFFKEPTRLPIGCRVCAKGALFIAKVDRLNGVTIKEEVEAGIDPSALLEKSGIFSLEQLYLIEAAFERSVDLYQNFVHSRRRKRVEAWHRKHPRKRDVPEFDLYEPGEEDLVCTAKRFGNRVYRAKSPFYVRVSADEIVLRTIMQNIVDNNGTFDPNVPTPIPERKAKQL